MAFLSSILVPTLKEEPTEASCISHKLMLRAGLIRQTASGIYAWLPLGLKVMKKIEEVIRNELSSCQEVLLPTIQTSDMWRQSGRYDAYGPEMLRILDRNKRELLYGPTSEEAMTDLFGHTVLSYKNLPVVLYNFQWKFRDEIRPKSGVMRSREFLMKDAYSFDISEKDSISSYYAMLETYLRIFEKLGLKVLPIRADSGPVGGSLSHEFHLLTETGDSEIFFHETLLGINSGNVKDHIGTYSATSEIHESDMAGVVSSKSIEIGHIFLLGTKYTETMNISVASQNGEKVHPFMGCYGIGVSRLVGAVIESSHDENGIVWTPELSPFPVHVVLIGKDEESRNLCKMFGDNVLIDDRDIRAGGKFKDADLIGCPVQIIVGPRNSASNMVEWKDRRTNNREIIGIDEALERLGGNSP